ncbi:MAG: hypothetical protein HY303_22425 [Candidatus Wallbacteria bacterium]|nr:hypothetical protein [Candidatus Wallbacteria bacterium]
MRCSVCGESLLGEEILVCFGCGAPHHFECWAYVGRCARYACKCREAVPRTMPRLRVIEPQLPPQEQPLETGSSLFSGDWQHGWEVRPPHGFLKKAV